MKYKKINMGSYNLHLIKTDKFKTTTVSVNFADRLKKDEITIRKFLFQMLCLSTKKYNTERLLSIKLEDLYAMNLGFANIAFGSLVNSYIDINFLDSEFSDDKLLDEALDFLFEILLNPNVKDNKFDKNLNDYSFIDYCEFEDSVYAVDWLANDSWMFVAVSYNSFFHVNTIPEEIKYKIII